MTEENEMEVKQDAQSADVQQYDENGNDSGTEVTKVDRSVYEQVRNDMLKNKSKVREQNEEIAELRARLESIEGREGSQARSEAPDAKVEILYMMNKDSFVRENLDLIEAKMSSNPRLTAKEAVRDLKEEFFDNMMKQSSDSEPEVLPKQIKPKVGSNNQPRQYDIVAEAVKGNVPNANAYQVAAFNKIMAKYKRD